MDTPHETYPGAASTTPAQGLRARLWRWRGWFLAAVAIVATLCFALALASPVFQAPFRLQAQTDVVTFTAKANAKIAFHVVDWELRDLSPDDAADGALVSLRRRLAGDATLPKAELLELWLADGDELTLQRVPGPGGAGRFAVLLPLRPVRVALLLAKDAGSLTAHKPDGSSSPHEFRTSLRGQVGGGIGAAMDFGLARATESKERFAVSGLGFGRPTDSGPVHAGLIAGTLHFLDKPDAELHLWRGTDLRLEGLDAELSTIVLSNEGIGVHVAGLTRVAALHVGTSATSSRRRSVMPTFYDWLKGEPTIAVGVGFIAFVCALIGLVLSVSQVSRRLQNWIRRVSGD